MNASRLIRELLELCRRVYARGFVSGSGGNISARHGADILITPTGRNLGLLKEPELVRLRLRQQEDGFPAVVGSGSPSQEWRMHCLCYQRPDVVWVIHAHSPHATAVSCLESDPACAMPVYTPGYSVRVGRLPVVPYFPPGSAELASAVGEIIAGGGNVSGRNCALLANHGLLAVGASGEQAMNIVEEMEENARLFLLLGHRGRALSAAQQAELAGRY
jgi:ribulose-5-phosphate 4-epimerase/fuculose-1-phosphate aldolase